MSPRGKEIERKFRLRNAPPPEVLAAHGAMAKRLEQVYLAGDSDADGDAARTGPAVAERVRRTELPDGTATYRRNSKQRVGAFRFDESEDPISEAEWTAALARADPERRPVRKTRYLVAHGAQ